MTFQDLIQKLNVFWAEKGCLLGQPYGVELGAGTGNPNTFFRVLGPEPFNVAYVEPSRRPTDGRYGKSPNRFQHYFQYQVILKPAPLWNQELFIESLVALGLNPEKHDIRFVEDNWESTPLGAWGLGWEVWCDGMEIAQYTYFQQMAGTVLEVPTIEITYGLERLAMYLQDVDHYKDLKWNSTTTYADLFERHEFWQATHNFETATPQTLKTQFESCETEVSRQLEQKNYWSAYDYLLKMSHVFNLLDARGMVSVSDRVAKFGAMGRATRAISELYLQEREQLGYPLLKRMAPVTYTVKTNLHKIPQRNTRYQKNIALVELGFEEIPAAYGILWNKTADHQWFKQELQKYGISYRKAYIYFTPRRIVFKIVQPSKTGLIKQRIKGPKVAICYGANNKPTPVLLGFLTKHAATERDIIVRTESQGEFVTLEKTTKVSLTEVLQQILHSLIDLAPKSKWMFWDKSKQVFIRPLRWILAFHNKKKLDLTLFSVKSSKTSMLPRYELPAQEMISSAQEYLHFIRRQKIILSPKKRMKRITHEILKKGEQTGEFTKMVRQNAYLTENPHTAISILDRKYRQLPNELLTLILEKNQQYPMTVDNKGNLHYHIVANHRRVHTRIHQGNDKVARARLEDGLFYFQQDGQKTLTEFSDALRQIAFHPKAGSYFDKKERIHSFVNAYYKQQRLSVPHDTQEALKLIKNDKGTSLGKEFPSLEGIIGKAYALRDGVRQSVAVLLADHYLPLEPNGQIPSTQEAKILSLADKLDSLLTLYEVEKLPEGNHDPFEIRKTVYRLLTLLIKGKLDYELTSLPEPLYLYIIKRFQQILEEEGKAPWLAKGIAYSGSTNIYKKYQYAQELHAVIEKASLQETLLDAIKRVMNIVSKNELPANQRVVTPPGTLQKTEAALHQFMQIYEKQASLPAAELPKLAILLEDFFTEVMVLDKEAAVRQWRLSLLARVKTLLQQDFLLSFN